LALGNIGTAIDEAEYAVKIAEGLDFFQLMSKTTTLGHALHQFGRREEASGHFKTANQLQRVRQPSFPILYSLAGFFYREFELALFEQAAWANFLKNSFNKELSFLGKCTQRVVGTLKYMDRGIQIAGIKWRAAQALKVDNDTGVLLSIALDRLTMARADTYGFLVKESQVPLSDKLPDELDQAVEQFRRAGFDEYLVGALLTRALVRCLYGSISGAPADLNEAWDIAERGSMRLHMADIHLHRARLFFREKPYPWKSPQADLAAAEKLINDCGYHRRDEELADAKRAILGTA
jgi:tetratricopeptide (TPR) repeat protein